MVLCNGTFSSGDDSVYSIYNTDRAKNITEAIGIYISTSMRPHAVVEEPGFKYLLKVLEPRYSVLSRANINQSVVPAIYKPARAVVEHELPTCTNNWWVDLPFHWKLPHGYRPLHHPWVGNEKSSFINTPSVWNPTHQHLVNRMRTLQIHLFYV